ncbi:MAG: hypothetical protein U0R49_11115 [Fimbriimonadales bacterium]
MNANQQAISDSPVVHLSEWDRGDGKIVFGYEIFAPKGEYIFECQFSDPIVCNDAEPNEFMVVLRNVEDQLEVRNHTEDRIHPIRGHHFYLHCQHKSFRHLGTPWETVYDLRRGAEVDASNRCFKFWFDAPETVYVEDKSYRVACSLRLVKLMEPAVADTVVGDMRYSRSDQPTD